jgi:hypothetical protein
MTTKLREVLKAFEESPGPISLNDMARDLNMAPGMLEGMIDYWVRKGKIRERGGSACERCHSAKNCSYSPTMPRSYELVSTDPVEKEDCGCCG